jgi:conjugal transfer/entry exclusion protein
MEKAKLAKWPARATRSINRALQALQTAKQLNPLNTDHTANIGRLYRTWAEVKATRRAKGERYKPGLTAYQRVRSSSRPTTPSSITSWDWGLST